MRAFAALALFAVMLAGCTGTEAAEGGGSPGPDIAGGDAMAPGAPDATGSDGGGDDTGEAAGEPGVSGGFGETGPGSTPGVNSGPPEEGADANLGETQKILVLGRSVSYGWASYMGLEWQEDESYRGTYGGYDITYREVASPPDIAYSAADAMEAHDSDIVFFKLCFVDFGAEYGEGLEDDKGYVEDVYREAVEKRGRKLVVGNALPQVRMHSTEGMERNHREFDEWLDAFAASHDGIIVLDLHGMLADGDGNLDSRYAAAPDDSHLNGAAYAKITPEFLEILKDA